LILSPLTAVVEAVAPLADRISWCAPITLQAMPGHQIGPGGATRVPAAAYSPASRLVSPGGDPAAHRRYTDISFFGSVGVRQKPQRLGLGDVILRGHAAIAGMRVAPEVGIHAGTVGDGNRMAPV
jgi:hypothetical protein